MRHMNNVLEMMLQVVCFCLLKTIEEGLPEGMWNDRCEGKWERIRDTGQVELSIVHAHIQFVILLWYYDYGAQLCLPSYWSYK